MNDMDAGGFMDSSSVAAGAATGQWWLPLAVEGVKAVGASSGSGPAAPSRSDSGGIFQFDNSGWTVATGGSQATATPATSMLWIVLAAAAAGLVAWKLLKKP